MVDVPNILLQTPGMKRVYAYVKDSAGGQTICTEVFRVNEKPKPDDYIYTETELWTAEKAVREALQAAKDSGEFDGPPGPKGDPGVVKFKVVNELPETDTENAIYLVPVTDSTEDNLFDEYIYVDGAWEKIGSSTVAVDLADYVKNTDYANPSTAGVVKVFYGSHGLNVTSGILIIMGASKADIAAKTQVYTPITPVNLDYAVKKGLADSKEEWTEDEKKSARELVGAVGATDFAAYKKPGLVEILLGGTYGIDYLYGTISTVGNNALKVCKADNSEIEAKVHRYKPIVPNNLDYAVKVGVTTNTIALTDEEKAAAQAWLGITNGDEVAY